VTKPVDNLQRNTDHQWGDFSQILIVYVATGRELVAYGPADTQKPVRVMLKLAPPRVGSMATVLRSPMHSRRSMSMLDSLMAMSFSSVTFVFCSRAIDWRAAFSFSFSRRIASRMSRISACSLNASALSIVIERLWRVNDKTRGHSVAYRVQATVVQAYLRHALSLPLRSNTINTYCIYTVIHKKEPTYFSL